MGEERNILSYEPRRPWRLQRKHLRRLAWLVIITVAAVGIIASPIGAFAGAMVRFFNAPSAKVVDINIITGSSLLTKGMLRAMIRHNPGQAACIIRDRNMPRVVLGSSSTPAHFDSPPASDNNAELTVLAQVCAEGQVRSDTSEVGSVLFRWGEDLMNPVVGEAAMEPPGAELRRRAFRGLFHGAPTHADRARIYMLVRSLERVPAGNVSLESMSDDELETGLEAAFVHLKKLREARVRNDRDVDPATIQPVPATPYGRTN